MLLTQAQGVLELSLGHSGAPLDVPLPRLFIKLLSRVAVGMVGTGDCRAMATCGLLFGVPALHSLSAFALAIGADMRSAFAFLLSGLALCFLAFGAMKVTPIALGAFIFRSAGLFQSYGDRLAPAFDGTTLAAA